MDDPSFLLPGTRTWRRAPSCPPPHFGWILTCQLTDIECFPLVATHAETLPPWIPLAIVAPPHLIPRIEAGVRLFDTARHGQTAVISRTVASLPSPEVVLQSINTRPTPTIALLAEWLAHRLGHPEHLPLLQAAMAPAGASTNHSGSHRTIQRQVQAEFEAHASDFRRVVRIARQERLTPFVSQLADLAGTSEARLRELVRTLLGVSLSFYNLHPGWEWVLEAACLRGLGVDVPGEPPSPPRSPGFRAREPNPTGGRREHGPRAIPSRVQSWSSLRLDRITELTTPPGIAAGVEAGHIPRPREVSGHEYAITCGGLIGCHGDYTETDSRSECDCGEKPYHRQHWTLPDHMCSYSSMDTTYDDLVLHTTLLLSQHMNAETTNPLARTPIGE